jgi:hypothetical protein
MPEPKDQPKINWGRWLIAGAILIVLLDCGGMLWSQREPPATATSYAGYLAWAGPARSHDIVLDANGTPRLRHVGESPITLLFLPSGPPMATFDRTGTLIDHTTDSGDDPTFQRRWPHDQIVRRDLSEAEIEAWFAGGR